MELDKHLVTKSNRWNALFTAHWRSALNGLECGNVITMYEKIGMWTCDHNVCGWKALSIGLVESTVTSHVAT